MSIVELIESVKTELTELKDREKKVLEEMTLLERKFKREFSALKEKKEDITAEIAVNEEALDALTGVKNNAIQSELGEKKPENKIVKMKTPHSREAKPVVARDESGEVIAEYASIFEASKDLGINYKTLWNRMSTMSEEKQIRKFGFVLKTA